MQKSIDYKKQADSLINEGKLAEAQHFYNKALEINPDYLDASIGLGFVLSEQRQYEQAKEVLSKLLNKSPNKDVYFMLSGIYEKQENLEAAVTNLELAIDLSPEFDFAHRQIFQILMKEKKFTKLLSKMENAVKNLPDSPEFKFYLAQAHHNLCNYTQAIEEYNKVLKIQHDIFPAIINLGNSYLEVEMYFDAMKCYNKALALQSNSFDAQLGLAKANDRAGYLDISFEYFNKCLSLNPEHLGLNINIRNALIKKGKMQEALFHLKKATMIDPQSVLAHHNLGNLYYKLEEREKALSEYNKVMELEPGHNLEYVVASLTGSKFEGDSKEYIEKVFDNYANNFEKELVKDLKYNAPQLVYELLKPMINFDKKLDILDLGCGTGLSGQVFSNSINSLVGVDLSAKMLEVAEKRKIYTRLERNNIFDMMAHEQSNSYDIIVSTDVFIYIGKIDSIIDEAYRLLHSNSLFTFSVEALEYTEHKNKHDFYLHNNGRYAHSLGYLENLAKTKGFEIKKVITEQIRINHGQPVIGYIMVWQKKSNLLIKFQLLNILFQ